MNKIYYKQTYEKITKTLTKAKSENLNVYEW